MLMIVTVINIVNVCLPQLADARTNLCLLFCSRRFAYFQRIQTNVVHSALRNNFLSLSLSLFVRRFVSLRSAFPRSNQAHTQAGLACDVCTWNFFSFLFTFSPQATNLSSAAQSCVSLSFFQMSLARIACLPSAASYSSAIRPIVCFFVSSLLISFYRQSALSLSFSSP